MNIIRKLRLNRLGCYKFKPEEMKLFGFIESKLLNLKIIHNEKDSYDSYMNKDGICIFQYVLNSNNLYVDDYYNYMNVWKKIGYDIEYSDLIKYIAINVYGLKIGDVYDYY